MKYLFILGRNVELSIAEVVSYFEKENNSVKKYLKRKNSILIELDKAIEKKTINDFGGVIAIGEILSFGKLGKIVDELDKKMIYCGTKKNINYVLWDFCEEEAKDEIEIYLKERFREEKLRATQKPLSGSISMQSGEKARKLSSNLIDEELFLFNEDSSSEFYFGKIVFKCDYSELEKRDMNKPVRREKLAISPRIAKILINLSQVKKGETLVDPFCGIGTILIESLIQGINVIGIDLDKDAVKGARQNLEWFKFQRKDYQVINMDSSKVKIPHANVIATEPDLGETFRKIPTEKKAREVLDGFESLIISVINNLKKNISGKIVFTSPFIQVMGKRIGCDIERILKSTKMKLESGFPIEDYREGQIVGRNIYVLE
jgi:tRNA G10  N-methylase Trm11